MEHFSRFLRVIAVGFITSIALAFLIVTPARAQNVGSLQGTVTDSSGAAIVGITITAPDLSSNVSHPITSGADGGGSSVIVREEIRQLQGGAL